MTNLTLIRKKSLAQEVADRLQQQIAGGIYPVGDKLPTEPELMQLFGVGRSSIREAVKLLTISGLLQVQQGIGTFILSNEAQQSLNERMNRSEIADILEVRSLLEQKIAEKAALNRTAKQLKSLRKLLDERKKLAESGETQACIHTDIRFHVAIAEACGNPILTEIYKSASIHVTQWFLKHNRTSDSFVKTHQLHEDLYTSIEAKDPVQAAKAATLIINKP